MDKVCLENMYLEHVEVFNDTKAMLDGTIACT